MALGTVTDAYELRFDAGRTCLDLLATTHPEERFDSVEVLRAWIIGAGLVPPGTPLSHADGSWLVEFRELRGRIGQLVRWGSPRSSAAESGGGLAPAPWPSYDIALGRVNDTARTAPPAPRAVRGEDGTLVRELDHPPECAALLGALARDAVELLTDPVARAGLRECEGDNCPIVYLDSSRGRRRRWCSSEVCGNRERVARHRRRAALARA
ncbi:MULTISPECIES: CGNR zinc finger domain-containing protein [unclassified Streptomyces]|uniref:CGNR zinc finger domain-containing protein n=1 Tax=unclassified Streptomyces TaxID=2593676 RepID=UPI0023659734|nr:MULTISPECIES: CGNR zinc finger domain-containing protein [unclassified Streptomyces]MDF3143729.1 CGNR zinc finger domain-containing protein [Streptomyces sp. T21Q-yed]WDF38487.1 CGNR zinc finger domain-containing protein [Streptomyces sp. T12]